MKQVFAALVLLLSACATSTSTPDTVVVQWTPLPIEEVRELCGDEHAVGCIKPYGDVCRIITEPMPHEEFTPFDNTMTSRQWRAFAHELYHCFGYSHVPVVYLKFDW